MHAQTIHTLASEARRWFERRDGNREADGIGIILTRKDGAPQWVEDLSHEAHKDGSTDIMGRPGEGSMLADDWRYEFVGDVLGALEDYEELEECQQAFDEWWAGAYEGYHHISAWLHSKPGDRFGYVEEVAREFGPVDLGEEGSSLYDVGKRGMRRELDEVWGLVVGSLEAELETRDEGE